MVSVVWAGAIHTPQTRVVAGLATHTTCSCGVGVFPSRVWESTPLAGGRGCTFIVVMAEAVAVDALG